LFIIQYGLILLMTIVFQKWYVFLFQLIFFHLNIIVNKK
jgi:hypothetical protein